MSFQVLDHERNLVADRELEDLGPDRGDRMQLLVARIPILGALLGLRVAELLEQALGRRAGAGKAREPPLVLGNLCDGASADHIERARAIHFEDFGLRTKQEAAKRGRVATEHEASRDLHAGTRLAGRHGAIVKRYSPMSALASTSISKFGDVLRATLEPARRHDRQHGPEPPTGAEV